MVAAFAKWPHEVIYDKYVLDTSIPMAPHLIKQTKDHIQSVLRKVASVVSVPIENR